MSVEVSVVFCNMRRRRLIIILFFVAFYLSHGSAMMPHHDPLSTLLSPRCTNLIFGLEPPIAEVFFGILAFLGIIVYICYVYVYSRVAKYREEST